MKLISSASVSSECVSSSGNFGLLGINSSLSSTASSGRSSNPPIRHDALFNLLNISAFHVTCSTRNAKDWPRTVFSLRECGLSLAHLHFLIYFVDSTVSKALLYAIYLDFAVVVALTGEERLKLPSIRGSLFGFLRQQVRMRKHWSSMMALLSESTVVCMNSRPRMV